MNPVIGKILFLNGASSSGKTSLAKALQQAGRSPLIRLSLDEFFGMLSPGYTNNWKFFLEFTGQFYQAGALWARYGYTVVVDSVLEREECLKQVRAIYNGISIYLIGLHCPLDVLEEREHLRGNRRQGQAKDQFGRVHSFCNYDFEVNTDLNSPEANAKLICDFIDAASCLKSKTDKNACDAGGRVVAIIED